MSFLLIPLYFCKLMMESSDFDDSAVELTFDCPPSDQFLNVKTFKI